MPIYEYECDKCGHVTEALRPMSQADNPLVCEGCGHSKTVRKQSEFAAGSTQNGAPVPPMGGCGRCGDPGGPCGMG